MSKLNIYDLCSVLTSKNGLDDKESHRFIKAIFDVIQEGLDEDKIVKVKGLGTFKIIEVDDRESINVNTGERVLIEGHSKLTFTPDSVMKEIVNKPFSQFETVILNEGVDFPEPVVEEPAVEDIIADEPAEDKEIIVEPQIDNNVAEQSVEEEPVAEKTVAEEPVAEETVEETTETPEVKAARKKAVPFMKRLEEADPDLKSKYEELAAYCDEYGLHGRMSVSHDTYRLHKVRYVVFSIRGKAIKMHVAVDPKAYENTTMTIKDDSSKEKYSDVPGYIRVKSTLSVKRAKQLIDDAMAKAGIEKKAK